MPLKAPQSMEARQPTAKARIREVSMVSARASVPHRSRSITEPATAMVAPTEISCPPEAAVTRVIPMARITSSEALFKMVMRLPERTGSPSLFCFRVMEKKEGSIIRLKITSRANATTGMKI